MTVDELIEQLQDIKSEGKGYYQVKIMNLNIQENVTIEEILYNNIEEYIKLE